MEAKILFAVCMAATLTLALAQDLSTIDELFEWIRKNGGEINGEVKLNKEGVRGLFATEHIPVGGLIAKIPAACMINVGSQSQPVATHIMHVLREYKLGNNSRYWPYINSWPKPHEVVTGCNMDDKYAPMWKSRYWENNHKSWKNWLKGIWSGSGDAELEYTIEEVLGKDVNVTLDDVYYASAITVSRYLSVPGRPRVMMAPIFDLANHDRHCATNLENYTSGYLLMTAGVDYAPGDEMCYSYGDLRDDYAVSSYGFLPAPEDPPRLSYVDHPEFNSEHFSHEDAPEEEPFEGTPEELAAEMRRLEGIRADILSMPDLVPKPEGDAYVWNMMKQLEARRIAAIDYEVNRLKELLAGDEHEEL